ncbi:MAG: DUF6986 family protein [Nocardioidaceae bacterium]
MSHSPPGPRLGADDLAAVDAIAAPADARLQALYRRDGEGRQPVHTVYVAADKVTPDLPGRWGAAAREALAAHAPSVTRFCAALGLSDQDTYAMTSEGGWDRVLAKLDSEPVEDLRIDLEDGYGTRDDASEDQHLVSALGHLADLVTAGTAPPFCGIRIKSMEAATRARAVRTFDLALASLLDRGPLPPGWAVTLPKVTGVEQVHAMVDVCRRLEIVYGLSEGSLRFEVQVETPQAVLAADGTALVARIVHESDGRLSGLHLGTYDYTAALGIPPGQQAMDHPVAEHAKQVMALAVAGTGVRLSDGSSNQLPTGSGAAVHRAWAEHARLVRRSLTRGYYQGWDLHPAQLPTRFTATYLFFTRDLYGLCRRLAFYLGQRHARAGQHLDEPATAQSIAAFLLRAIDCGAVPAMTATELTGADLETLNRLASRRVS